MTFSELRLKALPLGFKVTSEPFKTTHTHRIRYTLEKPHVRQPVKLLVDAELPKNQGKAGQAPEANRTSLRIDTHAFIRIPKGGGLSFKFDGFDSPTFQRILTLIDLHRELLKQGVVTHLLPKMAGLKSMPPKLGWPIIVYTKDTLKILPWAGTLPKSSYSDPIMEGPHDAWEMFLATFMTTIRRLEGRDRYNLKLTSQIWEATHGTETIKLKATVRKVVGTIQLPDQTASGWFEIENYAGDLCVLTRGISEQLFPAFTHFLTTFREMAKLPHHQLHLTTSPGQAMSTDLDLA